MQFRPSTRFSKPQPFSPLSFLGKQLTETTAEMAIMVTCFGNLTEIWEYNSKQSSFSLPNTRLIMHMF
jgi:hypothetical protein